ncbi:helix-turn-helix domain-containing protein [Alistipes putredinis]|jgi:hypothetical protein|uniref:helix-turn-helix domain-containing protein n=1 Tax=Alistipes TaxID=239759 RepID=UPI0024312301|nr:helix-turn-helix domain-containing protein [Alistipes putredinis]
MDKNQTDKQDETLCLRILDRIEALSVQIDELKRDERDIVLDYLDVCQVLHISVRHLRRLYHNKDLIGFKIGRRRFYRNSEVQQFIRKMEQKSTK